MEYETHLVELNSNDIRQVKIQLQDWKEEHGDVYITEFEEESSFIWRCLTRKEFNKAMEYFEDAFDRAEYVCELCVLDPTEVDYSDDMIAGIPEVLTENILRISGFGEDTTEMEMLMKTYQSEMQLFSNQVSCVIVEAFPYLSIEEVEDWNLKKMLWHYSRAQWTIQALRGIELVRDDSAVVGNVAPDGTIVRGDPKDFPELMG